MANVPPEITVGMSGSGILNGFGPALCRRCGAPLAYMTWHSLTHPAIQHGVVHAFAAVIGAPPILLTDESMTFLTPDNQLGATYAYWDGWEYLLGIHSCHADSRDGP